MREEREKKSKFKMVIATILSVHCHACLQLFLLAFVSSVLSLVIFITPHWTEHKNNYPLNTITLSDTLYVERCVDLDNDTGCPSSGSDGLVRMANYIFTQFRTGSNHLVHAPGRHNNSVKLKSLFLLLQFPILILKGCGQIFFYRLRGSCKRFSSLFEKYLWRSQLKSSVWWN